MIRLTPCQFLGISAFIFTLMGCNPPDALQASPGKYHGIWYSQSPGKSAETPVEVDVVAVSNLEYSFTVSPSSSVSTETFPKFDVKILRKKKISLDIYSIPPQHLELVPVYANCYGTPGEGNSPGTPVRSLICGNGVDINLNFGGQSMWVALTVTLEDSRNRPALETPAVYTLLDLMARAKDRGFSSAIDFDRVLEAKWKTQNAYLNLIPHLSINSVLNVASLNLLGSLKAVGDLVPFLFPTRWIDAKAAHFESEAEFDGWILSQADGMNIVEGLGIGVLRDEKVIEVVRKNLDSIRSLRTQVVQREKAGLMQAGSSDEITSIMDALDAAIADLSASLIQEKMALAEGSGFFNPVAILEVGDPNPPKIRIQKPYDTQTTEGLSQTILDASFERKQMDSILAVARLNHSASYFQWLDPSGSRDGGFGIGLIPYVKISAAQVDELTDRRSKVIAELSESASRAAALANAALDRYEISQANLAVQKRRVKRHLGNLRTGIGFSMSDLTSALQEKMKAEMESLQAEFEDRLAVADLNRLMLAGPYASLTFEAMPSGQPKVPVVSQTK